MLKALAISNYRSIRALVLPLGSLNLVTGANGSGKSNLYKALRLLSDTALGSAAGSIAAKAVWRRYFGLGPSSSVAA